MFWAEGDEDHETRPKIKSQSQTDLNAPIARSEVEAALQNM
jgi:hypothetical protein